MYIWLEMFIYVNFNDLELLLELVMLSVYFIKKKFLINVFGLILSYIWFWYWYKLWVEYFLLLFISFWWKLFIVICYSGVVLVICSYWWCCSVVKEVFFVFGIIDFVDDFCVVVVIIGIIIDG